MFRSLEEFEAELRLASTGGPAPRCPQCDTPGQWVTATRAVEVGLVHWACHATVACRWEALLGPLSFRQGRRTRGPQPGRPYIVEFDES